MGKQGTMFRPLVNKKERKNQHKTRIILKTGSFLYEGILPDREGKFRAHP